MKRLDEIDYVSGRILLTQFTEADEAPYFVVRVEQYCSNLEYIKVPSMKEARSIWWQKCDEYKERLSQGRPYFELQLAERQDGLWEFQSDIHLPASFYDLEAASRPVPAKTFKTRDEAINYGRTCYGKWLKSMHGHYDIVDKSGQVTRALSLKHLFAGPASK
jgi:hypothetical protein